MLRLFFILCFVSASAFAACELPEPPKPCVPHYNGTLARAQAEHQRCLLMDVDALRFYARLVELVRRNCSIGDSECTVH